MRILYYLCNIIIRPLSFIADKLIYRVKLEGFENVPKKQAAIICGNHVHALDVPCLVAATLRRIHFMSKKELFKNPGFRFMGFCFNVFPVDRGKRDAGAVMKSLEILEKNEIVAIYPEGTRNGLEKGVKPKNGAVRIAIKAGVPIVPFAVIGDFKPFNRVIYRFGEPIDFSSHKDQAEEKEMLDTLTNEVMSKVIELRDRDLIAAKK